MAAIYVGTYAKYCNGSLTGEWLDPMDYLDCEDFFKDCRQVHADEADPEFMFQDWEGIPDTLISESHVHEWLWAWLCLDEFEQRMFEAACKALGDHYFNDPADYLEWAGENFAAEADSWQDFAYQLISEGGYLEVPDALQPYLNYELIANDLRHDYCMEDGFVFYNT